MKTKNPHAVALGRLGGAANKGIPKPKSAENAKKGGKKRNPKIAKIMAERKVTRQRAWQILHGK